MAERQRRAKGFTKLKKALMDNLEARGLIEPVYGDMVDEYMELWDTKKLLEADIRERGVTVFDQKRGLPVDNISVSRRVQVSHQMLSIFTALGFKEQAVKARGVEGEDFEL